MGRGKAFQCEITLSSGVKEKLLQKHNIELWEIEEVIYDDPYAFSITYRIVILFMDEPLLADTF
jgi:hypothetical protein